MWGVAVGISLPSRIQAELNVFVDIYFRLMAPVIFDLSFTTTTESTHTSPVMLLSPETVEVAVGFGVLLVASIPRSAFRVTRVSCFKSAIFISSSTRFEFRVL